MSQDNQRRVFVVQAENGNVSDTDIFQLLSAAEIDLATVTIVGSGSDVAQISSNDALVLILQDSHVESATMAAAAFKAAHEGVCNIVGAWAPDQIQTGIHPAVAKFSTAQIPWDPERLKEELGSDCEHAFLTPNGDDADPNEVEPNECE